MSNGNPENLRLSSNPQREQSNNDNQILFHIN